MSPSQSPGLAERPLPTLTRPPFAGSCRIQPLTTLATRWFRVVDVPLDQPIATAVVVLESLAAIPRITMQMPLSELTRPYRLIHAVLSSKQPAFRVRAALALLQTQVPIRVALDEAGRPTRPPALLELRGQAPGGEAEALRIAMDWTPENWRGHVEKHLISDEDLAHWQPIVQRQQLPIRVHQLKTAVRLARRAEAGPEELQGLQPELWPLIEAYAAATVTALGDLLGGRTVHAGRLLGAPGAAIRQIDELMRLAGDVFGIHPGAEQLFTVSDGGLFAVARDNRGPRQPLRWRSTYPLASAAAQADKANRISEFAARTAGFDLVAWP
jgi:hypothetical protein